MACMEKGIDYRYYTERLPDPPEAEYIRTNREKYEPETTSQERRWHNGSVKTF